MKRTPKQALLIDRDSGLPCRVDELFSKAWRKIAANKTKNA
jgi:hypothetical protein